MKEFEGIKLVKQKNTVAEYGLVFWIGDEVSQDLLFKDEFACDEVLQQIKEGKGVEVNYDFRPSGEKIRVFPHTVIKVRFVSEYKLEQKQLDGKPIKFTEEVDFPDKHIGHNRHQPTLANNENN